MKQPGGPGIWAALTLARRGDASAMPRLLEGLEAEGEDTLEEVVPTFQKRIAVLLSNSAKASGVPAPPLPPGGEWKPAHAPSSVILRLNAVLYGFHQRRMIVMKTTWPPLLRLMLVFGVIVGCASLMPTPRVAVAVVMPGIVSSPLTTDEVVVADAIVEIANPASVDCTPTIQSAINSVATAGGGVVFIPAGVYRLDGTLSVGVGVTLRGDWKNPMNGGSGLGTILKATSGIDNENATPFITLNAKSQARNLSIWYPNQTATTIHAYPYTIKALSAGTKVTNITLYDSYNGIYMPSASANELEDVYGTILKRGLIWGGSWEFTFLYNIKFENSIWKNAPTSVITNAPTTTGDRAALDSYTSANLLGVQQGTSDGSAAYNVSIQNANQGFIIQKLPGDDHTMYGVLSKMSANVQVLDNPYPTSGGIPSYINTDLVGQTSTMNYTFATMKKPSNTTAFYNVKNAPYNAVGNGVADDTTAIQNALNAAASGGGTVYLPSGKYRINTQLTVPSGVELRGPADNVAAAQMETAELRAYAGKDTGSPDTATAFITINANAGVRGFSIFYPDQGYNASTVHTYPYTIRGTGTGVWVANLRATNSYNFLDLNTNRSDNHLISGVWANAYNNGIYVGNGSTNGVIERVVITFASLIYHSTWTYGWPSTPGDELMAYTQGHTKAYIFGNVSNETGIGLDAFATYITVWTTNVAGGANATFWHPHADMGGVTIPLTGYLFEGSGTINLVGPAAGGGPSNWLKTAATFTGTVNVYDKMLWANGGTTQVLGGTVNVYNEGSGGGGTNLALNKPATANSDYGGGTPNLAVDGMITSSSKWVSITKDASLNAYWLKVDLGSSTTVTRWVVRHAGAGGETTSYNTRDYKLQVSSDGTTFTDVDTVAGNAANATDRTIAGSTGRYFRLLITQGTQLGYDGYARIVEFELYGTGGGGGGTNLALNKPATANSYNSAGEAPSYAVDGNVSTKWTATVASGGQYWLRVDLGTATAVTRWVVKHAGAGGEPASYNTRDYKLQRSTDGTTFTDIDTVTGNTANSTDRTITSNTYRYFRLLITQATQPGSDGFARIPEFELYGSGGSTPTVGNSGFETPAVGSGYQYNPAGASWTFDTGSGVTGNGSAFTSGNPNAPQGTQVGFVQGTGSIQQAISGFPGGTSYQVTVAIAKRANGGGNQTIQVYLDTTLLGSWTPSSTSYVDVSLSLGTPSAGSHTLKFVGTSTGDNTAFIDNVRIT